MSNSSSTIVSGPLTTNNTNIKLIKISMTNKSKVSLIVLIMATMGLFLRMDKLDQAKVTPSRAIKIKKMV